MTVYTRGGRAAHAPVRRRSGISNTHRIDHITLDGRHTHRVDERWDEVYWLLRPLTIEMRRQVLLRLGGVLPALSDPRAGVKAGFVTSLLNKMIRVRLRRQAPEEQHGEILRAALRAMQIKPRT